MTQRDRWKKRPCVERYHAWADKVREEVRKQIGSIPDPATILALNWTAYFVPPASWSKKRRDAALGERHRTKPDRDNIDKAILDVLFKDDSAISDGTIKKRYDWIPRLEIEIVVDTASTGGCEDG